MAKDIKSMTLKELGELMAALGEKPYRARQVFGWLHEKKAVSYEDMTDLPISLREKLGAYPITVLEKVAVQTSEKDGTQKYLFRLQDGNVIESVRMRYHYGDSVCISSQVGCRMGCRFCASTLGGLVRNLLPSEMLEQIYRIEEETKERVSHVVVMGSGEPMDNYDNLLTFLRLITAEEGHNLSQRNITVSTCGIVPGIRALMKEKLQLVLALSLHAPTDEKRRLLMPIAAKYPLDEVLSACQEYYEETGRRVTFEYSLVAGQNDTDEDAALLARRLKPLKGHINLIPVNPVAERDKIRRPRRSDVEKFKIKLEKYGINVTIRREMGTDIDGACGQLRRRYMADGPVVP